MNDLMIFVGYYLFRSIGSFGTLITTVYKIKKIAVTFFLRLLHFARPTLLM